MAQPEAQVRLIVPEPDAGHSLWSDAWARLRRNRMALAGAVFLVVLAVALAFFVRYGIDRGFRSFEISLLAAAWIVPLLSRGIAGVTGIPLGLSVLLTLYAFTLRRALLDREHVSVAAGRHGIAQA